MSSKKPVFKDSFRDYFGKLLGVELDSFIEACRKPLKESVRVNTIKILPEKLRKMLESKGWVLEPVGFYEDAFIIVERGEALGNALENFLGYYYVQEQSSMIPPLVLAPKENDVVLDCCASPGSKTTELSQLVNNKGVIVANDLSVNKVSVLHTNLQRCGCRNVIVTRSPGQRFKNFPETFDKILLDAPCSGFGAIRKNWSIAKMFNPKTFKKLARTQGQLLESCWKALKKGGVLVYSTCTLTLEENEGVVGEFLGKHSDARIENISLAGFETSRGIGFPETVRIWPHRMDMEGFFVAKLVKI